jgi:glycosyltransferase involved in cell wall biosynthesis
MSNPDCNFFLHDRQKCNGIDYFVCVSEKAAEGFKKIHPDLSPKIIAIQNIFDNGAIKDGGEASINDMIVNDGVVNVVTVCRLSPEKGLLRCVSVHKRLEDEGIHFRWYIIGEGREREPVTELLKKTAMEKNFILLGKKTNPYPYMKAADIVTLLSFYEAFPTVIAEAKILGKPFLATDYAGSTEQLQNNVTGIIVDNNEEAIYLGLKKLVLDTTLRNRIAKNLEGFLYDNKPCFKKIKAVILKKPVSDIQNYYSKPRKFHK